MNKKVPSWILSYKEESNLSQHEKQAYYERLRRYCMERKLTNTTPGATFIGPKLKKLTGKIATKVCKVLSGGNVEVVTDGLENIPDPNAAFVRLVAFRKRLTYILRRRERKFM